MVTITSYKWRTCWHKIATMFHPWGTGMFFAASCIFKVIWDCKLSATCKCSSIYVYNQEAPEWAEVWLAFLVCKAAWSFGPCPCPCCFCFNLSSFFLMLIVLEALLCLGRRELLQLYGLDRAKEHDVHSKTQNPGNHLHWLVIKGPVPFLSKALPHLKAAVHPSMFSHHFIVCQRINKSHPLCQKEECLLEIGKPSYSDKWHSHCMLL